MLKAFLINLFLLLSIVQASQLENLTLRLKWKHQFQFAGYYVAKEKGYYEQLGIHLNIIEDDQNIDNLKMVENAPDGGVYSVGYPSIILKKANGANIVLLNAIYQLSPHILLTHYDSNISSIEDFRGKKIMINKDAIQTASFIAMINSHHIKLDDMQLIKPSYLLDDFIQKKVDIITAYISNEPYKLQQLGIKYTQWNPVEHGFDFYDDILYTSQQEVKLHPKRVEAFQRASLKGWEYAFKHIDQTIDIILKHYNTQHKTRDELLYEAKELKKLAYFKTIQLGTIDPTKIKRILDIYNLLGLVQNKVDINSFIFKPLQNFTLDSYEKEYLKSKQAINLCVNPNKLPFETLHDGKFNGISADYFKLIEYKYNLKFNVIPTKDYIQSLHYVKERRCDIISLALDIKDRNEYLNFTAPYLYTSLAIATKKSTLFITDIHLLEGKTVAISKDFPLKEKLKKEYPYLHIIELNSLHDGLEHVKNGEIFAFIGSRMRVSYVIENEFLHNLKISGKLDKKLAFCIGVRNDDFLLYSILQKAVQGIDRYEVAKIIKNWKDVKYVKEIDYELIYNIVFIAILVVLIVFLLYKHEKSLKEKLEYQNIVFETIINTIDNPMFYKDRSGIYRNVNETFAQQIIGVKKEKIIGKSLEELTDILSPEEIAFYKKQDEKLYKTKKNQLYETEVKIKDGSKHFFKIQKNLFYSLDNQILGYVGFMYDITDMKKRQEQLEHIASTDPLTQLYNRRYFTQISQEIYNIAKRKQQTISIIMLDIDNFKKVNDTYGHKIGDDVIVSIAQQLQKLSRKSDVACRFGGEEFLLLLSDTSTSGAFTIAQKIRSNVEKTLVYVDKEKTISVTVSIGVFSFSTQQKTTIEDAIKLSDKALYKAKENGKNRVETLE